MPSLKLINIGKILTCVGMNKINKLNNIIKSNWPSLTHLLFCTKYLTVVHNKINDQLVLTQMNLENLEGLGIEY